MALFVVSSDWRFKQRFKEHFTPAYLKEFTMVEKLLAALQSQPPDLLVIDEKLGTTRQLLQALSKQHYENPVLLCQEADTATGVQEFELPKLTCVERRKVDPELLKGIDVSLLKPPPTHKPDLLIGESTCMQQVRQQLSCYALQDCSVHLYGETGTGKEIAATYLHQAKYPYRSMVSVNCSLLNGPLGNAMFFGHARGAFTDGKEELSGLVSEADRSTLFLDEVENLSPEFQSHLLRLLETGNYRRYGDTKVHTSHFRLISASNVPLTTLCQGHNLRKDFMYRITDVQIHLPALREHTEDIRLLCSHYFGLNASGKQLDERCLGLLMGYTWPGNVRQLFSTLKRAIIRSGEEAAVCVTEQDLLLQ